MARDNQLPASGALKTVSPTLHTPWVACIVVAAISAIPFMQYAGVAILATGATAMIYLSYFLVGLAILQDRLKGWPKRDAPFKLGKWGKPASIVGLAYGGAMLLNFAWPRVQSNPTPLQTGNLVNFHWHWLNDQPILWTVLVFILLIGTPYYLLVQRHKPLEVVAPDSELPAPATVT
jgi:hypothetical protein